MLSMADGRRRVIIDVDVGSDDYMALLLLLHADKCGEIKIEALVCTMGNTTLDNVCKNVVRLLELVKRTDIPIYRGSSKPLIPPSHEIRLSHGSDGFGDLKYTASPNTSIIRNDPAATGLADLVLNNPNEITVIAVGPLTNIALTIRLYENFADSLKDIWIMGGNYTARGNITATAEFNFYIDPEAAFIVLDSITKPIFILTWETCLLPNIPVEWRFSVLGAKDIPEIELLNRAERSIYQNRKRRQGVWLPCDALLAAAFLYPETIITKKSSHNATVELHGSQTRGQIVLDHLKTKLENVTIIEEIDTELFKELVLKL